MSRNYVTTNLVSIRKKNTVAREGAGISMLVIARRIGNVWCQSSDKMNEALNMGVARLMENVETIDVEASELV